ncbi:cysteine-rich receptor-like protein kinase 6 [Oryza brachyantha]|uniref:Gnk2-homologous domain-containing protein n=1 Tax=Oryza brachyantha TaxID=4533 RepID=J3MLR2_ORYBR|nr:cysteine-rich receptor-like protein kinase 6 [Oryza brachyantha]
MARRTSTLVHAVLLLAVVAAVALPLAAAQPWATCGTGGTGTYEQGSEYESNLQSIALSLRDQASRSWILFSTSSLGAAPNTVYGLLQCRGDVSQSACAECGTRVRSDAGPACRRTRDVALVYDECYARLSDSDAFLANKEGPGLETRLVSGTNISSADVAGYNRAVTELLTATVQYAVVDDTSRKMFATGRRVGTDPGFSNIYSTAQCAFDITLESCRRCLEGLVAGWWDMFPRNAEGARVASDRCHLRSEVAPFYNGEPMVLLHE